MSHLPDWKTIDRYLAGEASPEERASVDAWATTQPDRAAALAWLRTQSRAIEPVFDAAAAWRRFKQEPAPRVVRRAKPIWRIAAAILLVAGLGASWTLLRNRTPGVPPLMREAFALDGQRTTVTLRDGTRISLNGGSRLQYASDFGEKHRDVYLEGEGYFEVVHDDRRPFRVHAGTGIAEDVGTKFTVRAYASDTAMHVAVSEGIVAIGQDTATVRVNAGELGVLTRSGLATVSRAASLDKYIGWTTGTLVFESVSLAAAARQIQHWYGVKVAIPDSALAQRPVTARFRGESVTQVLDALAAALGAQVRNSAGTFTLSPARR
jgi:transmembrane sensor